MKIQLTRDVLDDGIPYSNGQQLSEADVPLGTLKSLVQTGWAVEVRENAKAKVAAKKSAKVTPQTEMTADTADAEDVDADEDADIELVADLDISKNAVAALRKEGIETLEQAAAYIAKNGSLEPIQGVSKAAAETIAAALQLD